MLRGGPSPRGAPSVPLFCTSFLEKWLEIKILEGQTKAEPQLLSLRLPLKALEFEPFVKKNWCKTAEPTVHRGGTDPLLTNNQYDTVPMTVRKSTHGARAVRASGFL